MESSIEADIRHIDCTRTTYLGRPDDVAQHPGGDDQVSPSRRGQADERPIWTLLAGRRRLLVGGAALTAGAVALSLVVTGSAMRVMLPHPRRGLGTSAATLAPTESTISTTTTSPVSPPFPVDDQTLTFVDSSRATPARGDVPGHPGRVLVTDIFRPRGPTGPLPLVVFAHGWNSDPGVYRPLLDAWAEAGYLVAAPVLPDSSDTLPGSPVSNYPAQAQDLSFLITQLLHGGAGPVDPDRIAVAGHSDGGTDIALLALNPAYADPRIRAYLSLSGEIPAGVNGPWGVSTPGALLVVVGSADQYGLAPLSAQVFETAHMTKAMITVAGGDHLDPYVAATPTAVALRAETVRFLGSALSPGPETPTRLAAALEPAGDPSIDVTVPSG
jgi:pimeloyl-ACP methyl ester carboxylesterase